MLDDNEYRPTAQCMSPGQIEVVHVGGQGCMKQEIYMLGITQAGFDTKIPRLIDGSGCFCHFNGVRCTMSGCACSCDYDPPLAPVLVIQSLVLASALLPLAGRIPVC